MSPLTRQETNWKDNHTPESNRFGDVYYSTKDGVAESRYVYLEGNKLAKRWLAQNRFTVGELGFGTGLNFFLTWSLWNKRENRQAQDRLHYISFEMFPLSVEEIRRAISVWPELQSLVEELVQLLPARIPGFHRVHLRSSNVFLTLIYGDANVEASQLDAVVDAWYLDGFAPSRNPEMWNADLFSALKNCSHSETTFSTFSAARLVKDALSASGISFERVPGYSSKRDMMIGSMNGTAEIPCSKQLSVAVIGSGIAGATSAYALAIRGHEVTIFEREDRFAAGASGNAAGIIMPYPTAAESAMGEFFLSAHEHVWQQLLSFQKTSEHLSFERSGVYRLAVNSQLKNLALKYQNLGLPESFLRKVSANQIAEETGLEVGLEGFHFSSAGWVNPRSYCGAAIQSSSKINLLTSSEVISVDKLCVHTADNTKRTFDAVILANAAEAKRLFPLAAIRSGEIRGQLIEVESKSRVLESFNGVLCHEGYLLPEIEGRRVLGATYDRESLSLEATDSETEFLISQLGSHVSNIDVDDFSVVASRVGLRMSTADKRPYVGYDSESACYLQLGHGSRGLVSAALCSEILASDISGDPLPVGKKLMSSLCAERHGKPNERRENKNN